MANILEFWKRSLQGKMEYKGDFAIGLFGIVLRDLVAVSTLWVILSNVPSINGWSFEQLLFIQGLSMLTFGAWIFAFAGLWDLEPMIVHGQMDKVLTKPINPLLHVLADNIDLRGIGDILIGTFVIAYAGAQLGIEWTLAKVALAAVSVLGGILILFSMTLLVASVAFWTTRSQSLLGMVFHTAAFADYPLEIYSPAITFIISFVAPFAFVTYYPAQLFVGQGLHVTWGYYTSIVGLVTFAVAYTVWKAGLRAYTSTGS